jgi:hypothetical protein
MMLLVELMLDMTEEIDTLDIKTYFDIKMALKIRAFFLHNFRDQ